MSPRVTLRLPSPLLDRLDELAEAHHGGNRSAATRAALAAHLSASGPSGEQSHARADGGSRPAVEGDQAAAMRRSADQLSEAIFALDAVDLNPLLDDDVRTLLDAKAGLSEVCHRLRHDHHALEDTE